jgi:hypothetical protein
MGFRDFFYIEGGLEHRAFNKFNTLRDVFDKLVKQQIPENNIWVTFTDVPRITIWGGSATKEQGTPHGLYAYPVKHILEWEFSFSDYAFGRDYMVVFVANEEINDIGTADRYKKFDLLDKLRSRTTEEIINEVYQQSNKQNNKYLKLIYNYCNENLMLDNSTDKFGVKSEIDPDYIESKVKSAANFALASFLKDYLYLSGPDSIFGERIWHVYYVASGYRLDRKDFYNTISVSLDANLIHLINKSPELQRFKKYMDGDSLTKEELIELDAQVRISQSILGEIMQDLYKDKPQVLEMAEEFINSCMQKKKEFDYARHQSIYVEDFPKKKQFMEICKEYGLDLPASINTVVDAYQPRNEGQFIYRLAQQLAYQWSRKDNKPEFSPSRWRRILTRVGFTNVVDLKKTGTVHSSEETQGAFLDTRNLVLTAVIRNRSHTDSRFQQESPYEVRGGREQRNRVQVDYLASPEQKRLQGLRASVNDTIKKLYYALRNIGTIALYPRSISKEDVESIEKIVDRYLKINDEILNYNSGYGFYNPREIKYLLDGIERNDHIKEFLPALDKLSLGIQAKEQR